MRTRVIFIFIGFLTYVGLVFPQSCAPSIVCSGDFSDYTLNPDKGPCTKPCECNNKNYTGACVSGQCKSFKRESCETPGTKRPCISPLTECEGRQTCAPPHITSKVWGDCVCASIEQSKESTPSERTERPDAGREFSPDTVRETAPELSPELPKEVGGKINLPPECDTLNYVCTIAGDGQKGSLGGPHLASRFSAPAGIIIDGLGGLFIADYESQLIWQLQSNGIVKPFAGTGASGTTDGPRLNAEFNTPVGLFKDTNGDIYVTEFGTHKIRIIMQDGNTEVYAGVGTIGDQDGPRTDAQFNTPVSIVKDNKGNLYIAEFDANRIRKIDDQAQVSMFAGSGTAGSLNGQGTNAEFNHPHGLGLDEAGNLYVADSQNHRIRKITPEGTVSNFAGNGSPGAEDGVLGQASFDHPGAIVYDPKNKVFYISEMQGRVIRKIQNNQVTTIAGSGGRGGRDGQGRQAQFSYPHNLAFHRDDANKRAWLYITDRDSFKVRRIRVE